MAAVIRSSHGRGAAMKSLAGIAARSGEPAHPA